MIYQFNLFCFNNISFGELEIYLENNFNNYWLEGFSFFFDGDHSEDDDYGAGTCSCQMFATVY